MGSKLKGLSNKHVANFTTLLKVLDCDGGKCVSPASSTALLYQREDRHLTVICIHTSSHADWASTRQNLSLTIFKAWSQHGDAHAGCVTKRSKADCGVLIKATDSSVVRGLRTVALNQLLGKKCATGRSQQVFLKTDRQYIHRSYYLEMFS